MEKYNSILNSTKKLLGLPIEDTSFDVDILIHINTVFSNLHQMGIGPQDGFSISGDVETWEDFLVDTSNAEQIKTYMYNKVRLIFDPPSSSSALESLKNITNELEYRLYTIYGGY